MNTKLTKLAAGIVLGFSIAGSAHAGALGIADLTITAFGLINVVTQQPITSGITITSESRTGIAGSNYNGVDGTGVGPGSISVFTPGASVDVKYRCAGPDCGSISGLYGGVLENNTTTHISSTPAGNYAMGDMFIAGSIIGATGGQSLTRADASANGPTNSGGSNATILNSAQALVQLIALDNVNVALALSYDVFVKAFLDPLNPGEKGIASGGTNFSVTVTSIDDPTFTLLNFTPTPLNQGFTSTNPTENQEFSQSGTATSDTRTLHAGRRYNLTITQASNATVQLIPEPTSIALLGLGLLGMGGLSASRKRAKA